jgi:hypothetical protein
MVKVALPPASKSTVVEIEPEPAVAPQLEPVVAEQVQVAFVKFEGRLSTTVAPEMALGPAFDATMV